jgi:hypothetical protein
VDAGGQGLYVIFDGALRYLRGEMEQMRVRKPQIIVSDIHATKVPHMIAAAEVPYGYCTNLLLKGEALDADKLRKKLEDRGQSLVIAGDETAVRIHIHTLDPGGVLHFVGKIGTIHEIAIRNMDEQHQDFLEMQKERSPAVDIAIVTVVSGDGLADVFTSLGATAIVPGGQTMNPSTKDLLEAVESVTSDKVIILPNNKNIVAAASQLQALTEKKVDIIPSETIPQGVVALLAFDYEANLPTNVEIMKKAMSTVRSIEITRAVRSSRIGGFDIRKKQTIGFLDGVLVAADDSPADVLHQVLAKLDLDQVEVITIYYGADTKSEEAEGIGNSIRERYSQLQIEVVRGGQPHYNYIVSIE